MDCSKKFFSRTLALAVVTSALLTTFSGHTQTINTDIREYNGFTEGSTYFVKTGDNAVDTSFQKCVEGYWKINDAKFLDFHEIEQYVSEESFFVGLFTYEYESTSGSTGALNKAYATTELMLFKNPTFKKGDIADQNTLSTIELTTTPDENPTKHANIVYSVQHLQDQLEFVLKRNHKKELTYKKMLEERSDKNKSLISKKKLLLNPAQLKENIDSENELAEVYDHPFKLVDQSVIDQAIIGQDENGAYLRMMYWGNLRFVLFFSTKGNKLLYGKVVTGFNQFKVGPKFFKALNN